MLTTMLDALEALGAWSVPALWCPLLFWTAGALVALAALRLLEGRLPPLAHYRARQALLFALPLGLAVAAATDVSFLAAWLAPAAASPDGGVQILPLLQAPSATAAPAPHLTLIHALGGATGAAGLLAAVRLGQWAANARALVRFRCSLDVQPPRGLAQRLIEEAGLRRRVRLAWTTRPVAPMTFGTARPVVVLPEALRDDDEKLRLALLHELVHVRRCDALWYSAERFIAAIFFAHPLAAVLRRAVARCREQATDAAVLGHSGADARRYADLLYRFAVPPARSPRALAMAARSSDLKTRLEAMNNHANTNRRFPRPQRLSLALGVLFLAAVVGLAACSDLAAPDEPAASVIETAAQPNDGDAYMVVESMPELKGGLTGLMERIEYPKLARKAGIEGRVFVQFIIDEEGNVTDPTVLRSPHEALSTEALRVVRQAEFTPGRQNGQAVRVKMALPVTFTLPGTASNSAETQAPAATSDLSGSGISFHAADVQQLISGLMENQVTERSTYSFLAPPPVRAEEASNRIKRLEFDTRGTTPQLQITMDVGTPEAVKQEVRTQARHAFEGDVTIMSAEDDLTVEKGGASSATELGHSAQFIESVDVTKNDDRSEIRIVTKPEASEAVKTQIQQTVQRSYPDAEVIVE